MPRCSGFAAIARLLSAGLDFILAYDWHDTFTRAAGLFYPKLRQGDTADETSLDDLIGMGGSAALIADTIAMIHEVRWRPVEPDRLKRACDHLEEVTRLSRASWGAILAETDGDQSGRAGRFTSMTVTQDRVAAWMSAIGDFDAVLDGNKLLPHWRLEKGINLRRVVEEPRNFDLVLWITGHAAAPYSRGRPHYFPGIPATLAAGLPRRFPAVRGVFQLSCLSRRCRAGRIGTAAFATHPPGDGTEPGFRSLFRNTLRRGGGGPLAGALRSGIC